MRREPLLWFISFVLICFFQESTLALNKHPDVMLVNLNSSCSQEQEHNLDGWSNPSTEGNPSCKKQNLQCTTSVSMKPSKKEQHKENPSSKTNRNIVYALWRTNSTTKETQLVKKMRLAALTKGFKFHRPNWPKCKKPNRSRKSRRKKVPKHR